MRKVQGKFHEVNNVDSGTTEIAPLDLVLNNKVFQRGVANGRATTPFQGMWVLADLTGPNIL